MMMRDWIYARISEDDLGTERGVGRQLKDGRGLSAARGGKVAMELSDNDISALAGDFRPEYDRLMRAVADGLVDRIVVYQTSRLWRNRRERADGIEALRKAGVSVLAVKGPELDLSTASGRMMAGILGEFDTAESEIKGERVARAALERAQEGKANGKVAFGWRRIYQTDGNGKVIGFDDVEDESQSSVVREIVSRLVGGESLREITEDLNGRGIPSPGVGQNRKARAKGQSDDGAKWNKTSVKKIATRPANIALRVHHRKRQDEILLPASWPAIVSQDAFDNVVALLTKPPMDPAVKSVARPGARVHFLSWGVGECGVCESHLRVASRGNSKAGVKSLLYVCDNGDCVGRNRDRVDKFVGDVIIERLSRDDVSDLLVGDEGAMHAALEKAAGIRARLERAADDYSDEKITAEQMARITARLKPKLIVAESAARMLRVDPHMELVLDMANGQAAEKWKSYTITQRHAIANVLFENVKILKVTRRGPGFDPRSVEINWRGKRKNRDA